MDRDALSRIDGAKKMQSLTGVNSNTASRSVASDIAKRISEIGQGNIAAELGCDQSTVCRWQKDRHVERFLNLLELCNYEACPKGLVKADPKMVEALLTIASAAIGKSGSSLVLEDKAK
ncbi:MAG: hypothetical protein K6L81_01825 [Agarilytica sp.]